MFVSIVIPIHDMKSGQRFLWRSINRIMEQTYKNYEIIITKEGKMAENTNAAIKKCTGDVIKILYMDDYLAHDNALQDIADKFNGNWMVTGCIHDDGELHNKHYPTFNKDIHIRNTIGSPSVLTIKNEDPLMFDEGMTWMLDCDYYKRLYERYGNPTILNSINVVIGLHEGQATNMLSEDIKSNEHSYMLEKHDTTL